MKIDFYKNNDFYPIVILVKNAAYDLQKIKQHYVDPLIERGINLDEILLVSLPYIDDKAPIKLIKETLIELMPTLETLKVQYIYCTDPNYFKVLTGKKKAASYYGYVLSSQFQKENFISIPTILGINYKSIIFNDDNQEKLTFTLDTLINHIKGIKPNFEQNFLKNPEYPKKISDIKKALNFLLNTPFLAVDVETASLKHYDAFLGTICFSSSQTQGVAFAVDYVPNLGNKKIQDRYGILKINREVRSLLKEFFINYKGQLRFHNAPYDLKILIYTLWMEDLLDTKNLLKGLHVLTQNFHDTKVLAYLARNSTSHVDLSLKSLAHLYAGNYAQDDIKNILKIPLPQLLEYNLIDGCCTNYVFDNTYDIIVDAKQLELYHNLMLPNQKVITQAELTGMPLNAKRIQEVKQILNNEIEQCDDIILMSDFIADTTNIVISNKQTKDFKDRKAKAKNPDKILVKPLSFWDDYLFNPKSNNHLQVLLYEVMNLPIIVKTAKGQPSTSDDTITKLINHTTNADHKIILKSLQNRAKAQTILSTFISAFEQAISIDNNNIVWLYGSFNLGGTVSGRLSSSDPNLQNIPSGSLYGELIKSCFTPPQNWLMVGADSNSLEDMISALTTKDPNKLKVYTEGYDGHCLRAYAYFKELMPDIDDSVESINSIKSKYKQLRQDSKTVTFALTYGGTFRTLMTNCGFDEPTAKAIEASYHELYCVSDQWVQSRLDQAAIDGYITVAFGLRIKTPLLAKSIRNHKSTPNEAKAEARTAGNALGQSWCLLNNRALNEFMQRVWASEYALSIKPIAMIHDALYFIIEEQAELVKWVNDNLIECMQWQEHQDIAHNTVKLGAELDVFYQHWGQPITLPNQASIEDIKQICLEASEKYKYDIRH